ncbi:hypothetical protein [Shumkonia mesophila]|uniref:hypothetical protein n=1 Tax=Shumkonia mesophila TaxID=2838854 RepID=UPI0029343C65|nr:hypothetical protein [Shumkonia mesophila]
MAISSLRDALRWMFGRGKKEKSPFASEQEAYEFCQKVYKETGGVTPELRRAYDFYKNNFNDECSPAGGR